MNNNADALLFTRKVCVEAPQTLRSHRRIRFREILLACLRAKRFDMKVKEEIRVFKSGIPVNKQFKEILVMNLMYNLLLAIVLSVVAQILSAGGVVWPGIL